LGKLRVSGCFFWGQLFLFPRQGKGASFAFFADREASMAFWYLGDIISISHHRNITSSQHRIIPASPNLNVTYGEDLKWCENMHITSYHDRKLQLVYCMCKERAPGIQHSCGIHVQSIMRSLCFCRWSMRRTSKTQIHRFLHEAGISWLILFFFAGVQADLAETCAASARISAWCCGVEDIKRKRCQRKRMTGWRGAK
jgi:hypothetical protein